VSRTGGISDTAHRWQGNGAHQTAISQLEFMRESSASTAICGVSEPILAIVVQGKKKRCWVRNLSVQAAQYLVVSVDLPLSGFGQKRLNKLFGIQAKLRPRSTLRYCQIRPGTVRKKTQ